MYRSQKISNQHSFELLVFVSQEESHVFLRHKKYEMALSHASDSPSYKRCHVSGTVTLAGSVQLLTSRGSMEGGACSSSSL